ncbi:MAG: type II and III secretion system family protein, partial [Proteobacteria bacterium]|nr:type II and III secretion system family protein [Pseudomonadota bacterium]
LPTAPSTYSISKETGLVSVFASQRQHKLVQRFLNDFRRVSTMQILIEAKVLEVALTDEFSAGIDWGTFNVTGLSTLTATTTAPALSPPAVGLFQGDFNFGHGVKPIIQALSRFGTVRALSSPRVTVMNSQPAVVNVTNNSIYFDITTTTTPATVVGVPPTITKTASIKSAPEGVLMNVLPTANPDTGEILLSVRPSVSKVTRQVADPINAGNTIPELSVQEIDSIVKIQSGHTLVMGGLMKDGNVVSQEGIPVLDGVPVLGALFRNHGDKVEKNELVILLRATIVPGTDATATDADRDLFRDFGQDRRPSRL